MSYTRRELGKLALTVLPAARLLRGAPVLQAFQKKPDSKVAGVQIGLNVPYSFGSRDMDPDLLLANCVDVGISGLELRSQPVETFLGVQPALIDARGANMASPELRTWRLSVPMEKVRAFRKKYNDAGVLIEIVKFDGIYGYTDDVLDYAFDLAKNLGARAISTEIAEDGPKRLGAFADKHKMMVGYHGHAKTGPADWERLFAYAAHNGANLDIGHFVGGDHGSPVPFLTQYHDRITHIHVKDRKVHDGPVVPFGQGDTPITEVLRLIRDKKWNIQATIEFEYPVPAGSDRMTEIRKSIEFCRTALAT